MNILQISSFFSGHQHRQAIMCSIDGSTTEYQDRWICQQPVLCTCLHYPSVNHIYVSREHWKVNAQLQKAARTCLELWGETSRLRSVSAEFKG